MADKSPGNSFIPLPLRSTKKAASPSGGIKSVQTIQKIYEEDDADSEIELRKPLRVGSRISKSEYFNLQRNNTASGENIEKLRASFQKKRPKSDGSLIGKKEVNIDEAIKEADQSGDANNSSSSSSKHDKVNNLKAQSSSVLDSPKTEKKVSFTDVLINLKDPIPRPRKSLENLKKINEEYERENPFISDNETTIVENKPKQSPKPSKKDGAAKEVRPVKVTFDTIQYAEPEPRHIIVRQASVDSINLIQEGLNIFEMDDKRIGRRKSFLKNLFTSKSKKKEEDVKDTKNQNVIVGENYENENFNRASPIRHTSDSSYYKNVQSPQDLPSSYHQKGPKDINASQADIENNFAQMHLQKYEEVKKRFANGGPMPKSAEDYVCMDNASNYQEREASQNGNYISDITKNHDTCSSNTDSETTSGTYENALIAQAEMIHRKQINKQKPKPPPRDYSKYLPVNQSDQSADRRIDTPPRAQETYQNFELIKPRASIPINSERPLPNPYANTTAESLLTNKTIDRNLNNVHAAKFSPTIASSNAKEVLVNDIYGTVYDAKRPVSRQSSIGGAVSPTNFGRKSPAKLRLPANREKVELVPRMKSPIPQTVVSTDKIIATELLKNKKGKEDKENVSTHQNLSIEIDYPPENYYNSTAVHTSPRQNRSLERVNANQQQVSTSPSPQNFPNNIVRRTEMMPIESTPNGQGQTIANVMVDVHAAANNSRPVMIQNVPQQLSPYYSPIPSLDRRSSLSLSPTKRFSPAPLTRSPSKQEIRQSVEAFCWKEIKKLKDKQEDELYGYAQEPSRISRSMSVNNDRGRRSLSLPRELPKARRNLDMYQHHQMSLQMPVQQEPIYGVTPNGQYFVRNSPQRRTIESMHKSSGHLYNGSATTKPIFNRGSLLQQQMQPYNNPNNVDYNKKVCFINSQTIQQSWPTKNGFMQSPPQRRLDAMQRMESMEDDVFLPEAQQRTNTRPPLASNQLHHHQQLELQRRLYEQQMQQLQQEPIYGQLGPQQNVRRLTLEEMHYLRQQQMNQEPIYGRRQVAESLYGRTVAPVLFEPQYAKDSLQRRKLMEPQEPIYNVRYGTPFPRTVADGPSRLTRPVLPPPVAQDQGGYLRQVRVNNKECDMYGQIHEKNQQALRNAQVQQSGVMYGQLQRNAIAGPMQHKSYNQLIGNGQQQQGFVRNSRLTASANDMYRNAGPQPQRIRNDITHHEEPIHVQQNAMYSDSSTIVPTRPLPSVPNKKGLVGKNAVRMMPIEAGRMSNQQKQQQQQQQQDGSRKGSTKRSKVKSGK